MQRKSLWNSVDFTDPLFSKVILRIHKILDAGDNLLYLGIRECEPGVFQLLDESQILFPFVSEGCEKPNEALTE
jgi:hypothetical protein